MSRLRRKPGTKEWLAERENLVVLNPREWRGRWRELFGNDKPLHVELGMGKGRFISLMSVEHPEWNFIGIDMYDELIRKSAVKAEEARAEWSARSGGAAPPDNLRLVLGNVEWVEEMFAPGEVERIYLNFGDPWPKKRHAHRRLTHPDYLEKYKVILNENGEIHFKTDSRSLFEFSLNAFAEMDLMMRNISLDLHGEGIAPNTIMTEYEMKFTEQGEPIYRVEVVVGERAKEQRRAAAAEKWAADSRRRRKAAAAARTAAAEVDAESAAADGAGSAGAPAAGVSAEGAAAAPANPAGAPAARTEHPPQPQ